jgi:hypothetical protein
VSIKLAFIVLTLLIQASCFPLPRYSRSPQLMQQVPDMALLGTPIISDAKAAEVERIRIEKGIYWPNYRLTRVESTLVDGIYGYYVNDDPHHFPFLVDETFSFAKNGYAPWTRTSLGENQSNAPESVQDAMTRKAILGWISSRDTVVMRFGSGRKRQFLYLSAPDCPVAKSFEATLKAASKSLDATLYTKFISIGKSANAYNQIGDTLCAANPMQKWFKLRSGQPTKSYTCSTQPISERNIGILGSLLSTEIATPTLIAEDGKKVELGSVFRATSPEQAKSAMELIFDASTKPGKFLFPD